MEVLKPLVDSSTQCVVAFRVTWCSFVRCARITVPTRGAKAPTTSLDGVGFVGRCGLASSGYFGDLAGYHDTTFPAFLDNGDTDGVACVCKCLGARKNNFGKKLDDAKSFWVWAC